MKVIVIIVVYLIMAAKILVYVNGQQVHLKDFILKKEKNKEIYGG